MFLSVFCVLFTFRFSLFFLSVQSIAKERKMLFMMFYWFQVAFYFITNKVTIIKIAYFSPFMLFSALSLFCWLWNFRLERDLIDYGNAWYSWFQRENHFHWELRKRFSFWFPAGEKFQLCFLSHFTVNSKQLKFNCYELISSLHLHHSLSYESQVVC